MEKNYTCSKEMRERGIMSNQNNFETSNVKLDSDNVDLLRPRRPLANIRRYPPPRTTLCAGI